MENLENIKKYNTSRIDITRYMFSDDFTLSNYLNDDKVVALISLGVPCGEIQAVYKNREEENLSMDEMGKIRQEYVPINTIEELVQHRTTHFESYTINPNYIEPKKMQSFMYRFDILTDFSIKMFDINETNNHQIEMIKNSPIDYEK